MCKRGLCVLSLSLFFVLGGFTQKAAAQYDNAYGPSYDDFYQDLANYGQWIDDPQYGYVWSPNVDGSFRPYYTNGYWVMTEYGNTWVSEYQWGWACFHYGRWTYDNYYGWLWIPGSDWGPAWVSWRYGDGYYGWAPMGPGYELGADYYYPNDWWVFIPPQYLYSGSYYHYWYGPRNNATIIANTNYVNNTYTANNITYVTGPRKAEVEKAGRQPVQVYHLANSRSLNSRVHNNVVKLYHPFQVKPVRSNNGQRVTPPNVVSAPQPVKTPQSARAVEEGTPTFRATLPRNNGHNDQPGANINETATPAPPRQNYNENPYEYDVNRPVPQPARQTPAQQQPSRQNSQPQQPVRQNTQQPQPPRQQPQQPAVQQQAPRPQPAPAPQPAQQPVRQQPAPAQPQQAPRQQNFGGRR